MLEFSINAPRVAPTALLTEPGHSSELGRSIDNDIAFYEDAQRYGFNHVTVGHHWISHPNVFLEPWTYIAYLARALPAMAVSGFIAAPLFSALDLAEKVATLDVLSKGRFVFRTGIGWREEEFTGAGVAYKQRAAKLEESLDICRRLWTGEAVTYDGEFSQLDKARMAYRPVQRPHPPVWLAAQSKPAARRAARVADAPWIPYQVGGADVRMLMDAYRDELDAAERPFPERLPIMRFISVDTSSEAAAERARRLGGYFGWYAQSPNFTRVKVEYSYEEELAQRTIWGTPDEVVERLWHLHDEFGFTVFDFHTLYPSVDTAAVRDHLSLIGTEVLAPLRSAVSVRSKGLSGAR